MRIDSVRIDSVTISKFQYNFVSETQKPIQHLFFICFLLTEKHEDKSAVHLNKS